jgi:hypothetical protein
MEKMSRAEYEAFSESTYEKFASGTPDLDKSGAADMDVLVRKMVREGSYFDSILTPKQISPEENVITVDTDQHIILFPFEPDSPGAVSTYLDGPSDQFYMYGKYFPLFLREFNTHEVVKTLLELESYKYDIRQIIGDNMVKDLIAMTDYLGMDPINRLLGAANSTNYYVNRPLYHVQNSAITFSSLKDAQKPLYDEPFNLEPTRFLIGRTTLPEIEKTAIDEFRGTKIAEDIFNGSLKSGEWNGMPFVSTTKKALVPEGAVFFFPDEKYMGHSREHTPPTMSVQRKRGRIGFSYFMIKGIAIGHLACATRTDFRF